MDWESTGRHPHRKRKLQILFSAYHDDSIERIDLFVIAIDKSLLTLIMQLENNLREIVEQCGLHLQTHENVHGGASIRLIN